MLEVKFYDNVDSKLIKFAVIISKFEGKWVFCKHKERDTFEVPGGHREYLQNSTIWAESPMEAAKRELQEETGALKYTIDPICIYSVTGMTQQNAEDDATYGLLCYAEISEFNKQINSEIEYIKLFENMPENLTYPEIQPKLMEKVRSVIV